MIARFLLNALVLVPASGPVVQAVIQPTDTSTPVYVDFEGNQVFTQDQLRIAAGMAESFSQPGTSTTLVDELQKGLDRLRRFLVSEGYLRPRIGKVQVEESGNGLSVRVPLEEGLLYRLGEVTITGVRVFSEQDIIQTLEIKRGGPFRSEAIRAWFETLKDKYASEGYINWTPIPRQEIKHPSPESPEGIVDRYGRRLSILNPQDRVYGQYIERRASFASAAATSGRRSLYPRTASNQAGPHQSGESFRNSPLGGCRSHA